MRKFIAAMMILSLNVSGAYAFGWDDVSNFAAGLWNDTAEYFAGWFSDDSTTQGDNLPENIAGKWDRLSDNLSEALSLRDKQETLPDSSWFGEDKISNGKKIDELLDRALVILSDGEAGNARADALRLRARITDLRRELDTLRNNRINAPDKSYLFWRDTKSKIDAKISQAEKEISQAETDMEGINSRVADELSHIGITLTPEQADILINSATGDDIIHNTVIFENVKAVVTKLEELSQQDSNTQDITKRYAGMYLVLNDILILTQEQLAGKIDTEYRPKLTAIINEAETLRKDAITKSNSKLYTSSQRKAFALNAKSNDNTIQAAKLYAKFLTAQRNTLINSVKSLRLNRDLAENTYRTVRSSGELQGLIHSGLSTLDAVMKLSMPELKIFQGNSLRTEFDEINRRLKSE